MEDAAETLVAAVGLELVDVRGRLPEAGTWPGACSSSLDDMAAWHLDRETRAPRRARRPCTALEYESVHAPARPSVWCKAIRRRQAILAASAAVFEQVDLLLTADHADARVRRPRARSSGEVNGRRST